MRGLAWFLGISFLPAWLGWEIAIRSGVEVLSWRMQLFLIPGALCPALATFVVRKWITREGFDDLKLPLGSNRWLLYLAAWMLPFVVIVAMIMEAGALGLGSPDFTMTRAISSGVAGKDLSGMQRIGLLVIPQVMLTALVTTPLLLGEEFGWRGYLQRRLFPDKPVMAAVATGLIWAVWHYPLTLRGYNYPDNPILGTGVFTIFTMVMSYIFGWFYRASGSIWCNSLAHAATNAIGGALSLLWLSGLGSAILTGYGGLLALPPLLAVAVALALIDRKRIDGMTPAPRLRQASVAAE